MFSSKQPNEFGLTGSDWFAQSEQLRAEVDIVVNMEVPLEKESIPASNYHYNL